MRLDKFLAESSVGTRKTVRSYIKDCMVKVNGDLITEPAIEINESSDVIEYLGKVVAYTGKVYYMFNKPSGYITARKDAINKTVFDFFDDVNINGVFHVGRLDKDTEGLLLFTNDGDLAKKLTHPKYGVRKLYHVGLDKALSKNDMLAIADGITLDDGPVSVDEIAYVNDDKKEIGIEIHSGQNRVVRRIFESLGYEVEKLDRVVFANLTKKDLARGRWRLLEQHEINTLKMSL